ncbi:MAG TPA: glycosyltransferase family 4 protein, partial [Stellaceae bacterium]|nr:glycosyltransferase family 4 protein [Stellaceae bacterium]
KPAEKLESIPYFWRMLYENTRQTRGSVQRIAFPRAADQAESEAEAAARHLDGYQAFELMIARSTLDDPHFAERMRRAEVTVVNHVFHSGFAFAHTRKIRILETHDIQSYNLSRRPLRDPATGHPEKLSRIMGSEMASVAKYDFVVNVAPEEHTVLSLFNPRSARITPFVAAIQPAHRYGSVAEFAAAAGLHESYQHVHRFDLLLVGDSHPNNLEAGRWVLQEVFKPFLQAKGYNLAVCGRLSDALFREFEGLSAVFFVGFVEDLGAVYDLSRLVLLPDRVGTGISIKTLEALAVGKPVVATPTAVRGFRADLPEAFRTYEDAEGFAKAVLAALASEERMRALAELSRRSYAAIASRDVFEAAWDHLLRSIGVVLPNAAPAAAAPEPQAAAPTAPPARAPAGEPGGDAAPARRMPRPAQTVPPRSGLGLPVPRIGGGAAPVVVRLTPAALHMPVPPERGAAAAPWEACRALLRFLPERADVIAASRPGSYLERRLRESVAEEQLFLHALPPDGAARWTAPAAPCADPSPLLLLGDRDRDVAASAAPPWPAAAPRQALRIRTLDTLYAVTHRPGLIVIEQAAAAPAILAGSESLARGAPMFVISLASTAARDRTALAERCLRWLAEHGYDCLDGRFAPLTSAAAADAAEVICGLPPALRQAWSGEPAGSGAAAEASGGRA